MISFLSVLEIIKSPTRKDLQSRIQTSGRNEYGIDQPIRPQSLEGTQPFLLHFDQSSQK